MITKLTSAFQVRKSFFNDLGIQNNVSIVDLLYEQFYTGSEADPSPTEQEFMKVIDTLLLKKSCRSNQKCPQVSLQGWVRGYNWYIKSYWYLIVKYPLPNPLYAYKESGCCHMNDRKRILIESTTLKHKMDIATILLCNFLSENLLVTLSGYYDNFALIPRLSKYPFNTVFFSHSPSSRLRCTWGRSTCTTRSPAWATTTRWRRTAAAGQSTSRSTSRSSRPAFSFPGSPSRSRRGSWY